MAHPKANNKRRHRAPKEKPEFDQTIVDLARVTRVTKGGKHMSFRALILIGDRKGRVGYGVQKGSDVQIAVDKAVKQAEKNIITVPFNNETIPHRVESKFGAARVMVKPAPQGSGIIAGSAIRTVLEFAGVPNASAKMLGKTNNKIANVKATFEALTSFKPEAVKRCAPKKQKKKTVEEKPQAGSTNSPQAEKPKVVKKAVVKETEKTEKNTSTKK